MITARGEEVRESELLLHIAASGDLPAASGDAVSDVELFLHKRSRMSGKHGVQCVAQCVACAAPTLVVWQ